MTAVFTEINRDAVLDGLYAADHDESALYERYSGRFMFGAECFGVVLDGDREFARFVREVSRNDDLDASFLDAVRSDSMGRSTIYYFPGYGLDEYADGS